MVVLLPRRTSYFDLGGTQTWYASMDCATRAKTSSCCEWKKKKK